MDPTIVTGQSARAYFSEAVSDALQARRTQVQAATQLYLVDLLDRFMEREQLFANPEAESPLEPLALVLARALQADPVTRRRELQRLGDTALFVSGFFGDALARSPVDPGYYMSMGERAYDALAEGPAHAGALFGELSHRFPMFVDVYAEIAELADLGSNRGLVRLYERFLLTGSERVARRLRERGVALFAGPGTARYGPAGGKPSC